MLQFTCGSSLALDLTPFDGVVIGYHWQPFNQDGTKNSLNFPNKIIRAQFLYGNKHHKPCPFSGCDSIIEWVHRRVERFPQITEWVLVNEWSDDLGVPYPNYSLDSLKRYCEAAYTANPSARIILGDFRPHLLNKWRAIANICHELAKDCPVEVGIQTHIKSYNAPVILARLPEIIGMFGDIPVHFIEASLWYKSDLDKLACDFLWRELEAIANNHQIKSFCNWWLCSEDAEVGRRMPTFENLQLYSSTWLIN
jgi:hypothetical protein